MTSSLLPLGAFVVVVALIPIALWTLKRAGLGGAASGGVLRHVANLGLGTQQRVSVVEVTVGEERHWLVLGVTGEQVTSLATYVAPPASATDLPPGPPGSPLPPHVVTVQQLVARWRGQAGQGGSSRQDRGE